MNVHGCIFLLAFALLIIHVIGVHSYNIKYNKTKNPSPLILVPGDGGSRSYAKLNYHVFSVTRLVWVNFEFMLFPGALTNVFKLNYNPETHTTSDVPNSEVMFPGWGSTEMIEDLDEWKHRQTTYFSPLVQELIKDKYYLRNKTIRGAPYDFRKAPNENTQFVENLKTLIEDTYRLAGNERVVILGHSLGSLYSLHFLEKMSLAWKKKYVRSLISVSGPLAGAVKAVKLHTTGDTLGSPRSPFYFRDMQRSFPSTAFLFPRPEVFGSTPIVITAHRNYSARDYESLFKDMDFPHGHLMYNDTKNLIDGSKSPEGIDELYCIHGVGLPTEEQLLFSSFPNEIPNNVHGDGDSTVNIKSLQVCQKWQNVNYHTIEGADHMAIVGHGEFMNKLKQILYRAPGKIFQSILDYELPRRKFIVHIM